MQHQHIISCDWGTSSLRLQLVSTSSLQCVAKVSSHRGNAAIFNEWKADANTDRITFYLKQLQPLLNELSALARMDTSNIPVIVSGMASSTVGIKELRYADVPFKLDGSSPYTEWLNAKSVISNSVLLISGVQQHDDVMRGEETQLMGVVAQFNFQNHEKLLFVMPGTHSKHIEVTDGTIINFKTFMTGEIFDTLTKYTVLSHAVASTQKIGEEEREAFTQGVRKAMNSELLNALFSVRINQLKKYLPPEHNYYYLSGLLIGSELRHIVSMDQQIVLCSTGSLLHLYETAINCAGLSQRTIIVPENILDNAAAAGQLKIINNIKM